jgi:hypothetical protein
MTLVLLLALLLPLQNFASGSCSAQETSAGTANHHCANDPGNAPTGAEQHHHCGMCCVAAIALMPFRWTPPRSPNFEDSLPLGGSPPTVTLDRLDRPPRPLSS